MFIDFRERERETETEKDTERQTGRDRESMRNIHQLPSLCASDGGSNLKPRCVP